MEDRIRHIGTKLFTPRNHAYIAASTVLVGMTVHGTAGYNFYLFAALAGLAVMWVQWPDTKVMILLGFYAVSILMMPFSSLLWGDGRADVNMLFIMATMPAFCMVLVPSNVARKALELCFTWGAMVFAFSLVIDGLFGDETLLRFSGVANNTNSVSCFLLLATAFMCWKNYSGKMAFIALLLIGQYLTGSRMGIGMTAIVIFIALLHSEDRLSILGGLLLATLGSLVLFPQVADTLAQRTEISVLTHQAIDRSTFVQYGQTSHFLPTGALSRTANDTHFTFLRITQEAGLLASLSLVTLFMLAWKRANGAFRVALILMLASMSVDLQYWMPPNTVGFLWLFMAAILKGVAYESTDNTLGLDAWNDSSAGISAINSLRINNRPRRSI